MNNRHICNQNGVSLVEILVGLAISAVIATAMASLFANSVRARQQIDVDGQRTESGRYAISAMLDDIRLAGFYGDFMPRSSGGAAWPTTDSVSLTWTTPDPCETTLANLGWNNTGTVNAPVAVFGYEGGHTNTNTLPSGLQVCLQDYKTGTDVFVIRRVSTALPSATAGTTAPLTPAAITPNDVYLQGSSCATQSPRFVVSSTASDFSMQTLKCNSALIAPLRKVFVRIFYVATCGKCSGTPDNIPTLKVLELYAPTSSSDVVYHRATNNWLGNRAGTLAIGVRSLAQGIEDMHVEYGMDNSADLSAGSGGADAYVVPDSSATLTSPSLWQNVMAIKVWVVARDLDARAGYSSDKRFVMGSQTVGPYNSSNALIAAADYPYKRDVFFATIRLVNPSGAREMP